MLQATIKAQACVIVVLILQSAGNNKGASLCDCCFDSGIVGLVDYYSLHLGLAVRTQSSMTSVVSPCVALKVQSN